MDNQVDIKQVGPADVDLVVELARKTFRETYADYNDPNELMLYMDRALTKQVLQQELDANGSAWYIGCLDGVPVGFFKIRWESTPKNIEDRKPLELQRIYVLQEYQGFSIGKALITKVKEQARSNGYNTIWLQVWQKNTKAIKFYQSSGFVVYETDSFLMGNEVQQDFLMRYDLYY
jgi:diamine N-acetyltransferase